MLSSTRNPSPPLGSPSLTTPSFPHTRGVMLVVARPGSPQASAGEDRGRGRDGTAGLGTEGPDAGGHLQCTRAALPFALVSAWWSGRCHSHICGQGKGGSDRGCDRTRTPARISRLQGLPSGWLHPSKENISEDTPSFLDVCGLLSEQTNLHSQFSQCSLIQNPEPLF